MENPAGNQLPEADSLPDGFVESSAEPLPPSTPILEKELPVTEYKEGNSVEAETRDNSVTDYKEEKLVEPIFVVGEFQSGEKEKQVTDCQEEKAVEPNYEVGDFQSGEGGTEKAEKLRTFPVSLCESDGSGASQDASQDPVEVAEKGCLEQSEGSLVAEELATAVSEVVLKESAEEAASGHLQEEVKGAQQSLEKSYGGGPDPQAAHMGEKSSSESIGNNRKVEASDVKRKSTKRTFKSEKEFLEFTLKYQQVLADRDAAIAVRDKLESLCRELQRQNKMLMDECKRVSTESQTLRLDLSNKFQDAIKEVGIKLEQQKEESLSQLQENEMLRSKLKQLADQYTLSEKQNAQKLKQKSLELQLSDLKLQQHEQKLIQEQSQMKLYAEQVSQLLATEKNLRIQLTADGEKFQQFQEALLKSNEVFETFRQEIDKMSKSIKELKKENSFLKSKSEKSDVTLIELVEEREHLKKQLEKTRNQKEKLESLCRSLQAERKLNSTGSTSSDSAPL